MSTAVAEQVSEGGEEGIGLHDNSVIDDDALPVFCDFHKFQRDGLPGAIFAGKYTLVGNAAGINDAIVKQRLIVNIFGIEPQQISAAT